MKQHLLLFFVTVICLGCAGESPRAVAAKKNQVCNPSYRKVAPQLLAGILIDVSGSVMQATNISTLAIVKRDLLDLVSSLPPKTRVIGHWITAKANYQRDRLFDIFIPTVPIKPDPPKNRFDPAQRRQYRELMNQYQAAKACELIARTKLKVSIKNLAWEREPEGHTDLNGAIFNFHQVHSGYFEKVDAMVIIYSDAQQTAQFDAPDNPLQGSELMRVIVKSDYGYQPNRVQQIKQRFRKHLFDVYRIASQQVKFQHLSSPVTEEVYSQYR